MIIDPGMKILSKLILPSLLVATNDPG